MKKATVIVLFLFCFGHAYAQHPIYDLYDMDFRSLSKLKVTTASKSEQSIGEIPSTVRIVSGARIEERGYETLDELLADLPGFQFRNQMSQNSYIFQRGIPNQNNLMLVLIDGVQINELNSGGFYGGSQYNLSNVDRVEVVYGPASVVYGTNAMSGVVNIITKDAATSQNHIGVATGRFNTIKADLGYRIYDETKRWSVRVAGMVRHSELANLKGAYGDYNWTHLMDNFENNVALDLKAKIGQVVFGANIQQKQTSTATLQPSVGSIFRDYGTLWNILFANAYIKHTSQINPKIVASTTTHYRNTTVLPNTVYAVVDTAQIGYYRPNQQIGIEEVFDYRPTSGFTLSGGVKIEYEQLSEGFSVSISGSPNIAPPQPEKPKMQDNYLISIFSEPKISIGKSVFLSGGLRYDLSSVYHQIVTPRVGVTYNYRSLISRFLYAEAFRAPKPWDYTDGLGNPGLVPERIRSFEASAGWLPTEHLKFEVSAYQNYLKNGFIRVYDTENNGFRWQNSTIVKTNGLELSAQYVSGNFETGLNYSYTQSHSELNVQIPEISHHMANFFITYPFSSNFKLNFRLNYAGQRENHKIIAATNNKIVGPDLIANGALTYHLSQGTTLKLTVKNLFDTEYCHTSNRQPDRYRQAQRMLMLSVKHVFPN